MIDLGRPYSQFRPAEDALWRRTVEQARKAVLGKAIRGERLTQMPDADCDEDDVPRMLHGYGPMVHTALAIMARDDARTRTAFRDAGEMGRQLAEKGRELPKHLDARWIAEMSFAEKCSAITRGVAAAMLAKRLPFQEAQTVTMHTGLLIDPKTFATADLNRLSPKAVLTTPVAEGAYRFAQHAKRTQSAPGFERRYAMAAGEIAELTLSRTHANPTPMDLLLVATLETALGRIRQGMVTGWAVRPAKPGEPAEMTIGCLDDEVARRLHAIERERHAAWQRRSPASRAKDEEAAKGDRWIAKTVPSPTFVAMMAGKPPPWPTSEGRTLH